MTLPHELGFLEEYFSEPKEHYRKAVWLLSDFDADVWSVKFTQKNPIDIDWRVELYDGSNLVDEKNSDLLNGLKYWVIGSTTSSLSKGLSNSLSTQYTNFRYTFNLIDHLLINDHHFKLHKFGLAGISTDDLKGILYELTSDSGVETLFDWNKKLIEFANGLLASTDTSEIQSILSSDLGDRIYNVSLDDLNEAEEFGVEPECIPLLRAAIYTNGFWHWSKGISPNSIKISKEIYHRSIRIKEQPKSSVDFLSIPSDDRKYNREFIGVRVKTGEMGSISQTYFRNYRRCLYSLGVLHEVSLPAPSVESLVEVNHYSNSTKRLGRYRTIPSAVVFDAFKGCVEFHFEYGREIIDAYLRLAIYAMQNNCLLRELPQEHFDKAIGPKLKNFGVRYFSLDYLQNYKDLAQSREDYFESFRSNTGLYELLCVYFGATQLVVGALTARRSGELADLLINGSTDVSGGWIIFNNRKSSRGLFGLRSEEARPIEPVAVQMMQELERFHKILNRVGFGEQQEYLFSSPNSFGTFGRASMTPSLYSKHLDMLCDYLQTGFDAEGRRYYIRQHQLRRFFAILFFYSNSFGGLETLQWMLGHTDVSHVWHYITETIGGDILRSAKSQYVAESLHRNGVSDFKELADLMKARYGTDDFTLIDTEELEEYVSELLEEGDIEVEPEFFEGADGEEFKVVVKVREMAGVSSDY